VAAFLNVGISGGSGCANVKTMRRQTLFQFVGMFSRNGPKFSLKLLPSI
jgi:hypothetical protein